MKVTVRRLVAAFALSGLVVLSGCSFGNSDKDPDKSPEVKSDKAAEAPCTDAMTKVVFRAPEGMSLSDAKLELKSWTLTESGVQCTYTTSKTNDENPEDTYVGELVADVVTDPEGAFMVVERVETPASAKEATDVVDSVTGHATKLGGLFVELEGADHPKSSEALSKLAADNKIELDDGYAISSYGTSFVGPYTVCVTHADTGAWALYGTYDENKASVLGSGPSDSTCVADS